MSQWRSTKAKRVLAALLQIGWTVKREKGGSHRILSHPEYGVPQKLGHGIR
jgi:predicted RNA binding protein YcfA (HicA-like mRNA interferase family)